MSTKNNKKINSPTQETSAYYVDKTLSLDCSKSLISYENYKC